MENILDERIRSLARQSELTVPGDYESNIEQLLDRLMAQEKVIPIKRYRSSKKVAAVVAFCVLFGSGGVYATYNYGNLRMQQMKPDEISEFKEDMQASTEGADHYSRKMSASEQDRLIKLTTQYESEGVFPEGKILEVDAAEDVFSDQLCFVSTTSTFYLPKREMTDEELLELIDFYSKRDFSIKQKSTGVSTERSTEMLLGQSAAVTIAADTLEDIDGINVSQMEYSISQTDVTAVTIHPMLTIQFGTESDSIYRVTLDGQTHQVTWIFSGSDNNFSESIACDEEEFESQYSSVKDLLQSLLTDGQMIQNSYLTYSENKDDALVKNGVLTYYFALSDGSGYELDYSCTRQVIYGIRYIGEVQSDQTWNERVAGLGEEGGYIAKVIQLQ